MVLVRSLLFDACFYLAMAVMGILGAPRALWSVDGAYAVCHDFCRVAFWLLRTICGLRVEVRGPVPTGEVVVAAKHQSFLDILILFDALPRPKFIMKKELKWAPFLGLYALRIGSTPVNRGARGQAMKAMVAHAGRATEPPCEVPASRPIRVTITPARLAVSASLRWRSLRRSTLPRYRSADARNGHGTATDAAAGNRQAAPRP